MNRSSKLFSILGIIFGALGFICSEALFVQYVIKDDAWCILYGFIALFSLGAILLNVLKVKKIKKKF